MTTADFDEERLAQRGVEGRFRERHGQEDWTTLFASEAGWDEGDDVVLYSALLPEELRESSLTDSSWDLLIGDGLPGFSQWSSGGGESTEYYRFGTESGVEAIVVVREFPNHRPRTLELSEELRHVFNLYEDDAGNAFLIEDDGSETQVVRRSTDRIEIRTSLLRRYQALKQKHLALFIESQVRVPGPPDAPDPPLPPHEIQTETTRVSFHSGSLEQGRLYSRMIGKKLVAPPPIEQVGLWPYERPKEYLDFVIREDELGNAIEFSSNPGQLANYFGGNPDAPHYLTPVYFRRDVLAAYYEDHERYEVADGYVRSHGAWGMEIDNNSSDYVVAYLGDLGRDLPTSVQRYWRGFNFVPPTKGLSDTAFRRDFLAQFADPESAEHQFKQLYPLVSERWQQRFGWPLFKPLHRDDQHVFSRLRIPLVGNAAEFDAQVQNLAKLLVDSLNEESIGKALPSRVPGEKGIAKFERFLESDGYPEVDRDIVLLRTLFGLRSKGAAHRKGEDFDIQKAGLDPSDLRGGIERLLRSAVTMLRSLAKYASPTSEPPTASHA